jgi:hypothetical protein
VRSVLNTAHDQTVATFAVEQSNDVGDYDTRSTVFLEIHKLVLLNILRQALAYFQVSCNSPTQTLLTSHQVADKGLPSVTFGLTYC